MSDETGVRSISIVIPARNAEATLAVQLHALLAAGADSAHEVVVVDSGSTDRTKACAESFSADFHRLIVVSAPAPGAATARNTGVAASSGELILFCDADDRVDRAWIQALARALDAGDAAAGSLRIGGLVPLDQVRQVEEGVLDSDNPGPAAAEHIEVRYPSVPDPPNFLKVITANAGVRRTVFDQIGGFDTRYDGLGNEDGEFYFRLQLLGHSVVTAPEALVDYRLRASTKAQVRQAFRNGRGTGLFYRQYPLDAARSGIQRSPLPRTVISIVARAPRALRHGSSEHRLYLWLALARAAGCALGFQVDARRRDVAAAPSAAGDATGVEHGSPAAGGLLRRAGRSLRFRLRSRRARIAQWMVESELQVRNRLLRKSVLGGGPVVVSMTSHGQRISSCHLALESIARGTMRPGRLVLWLSESEVPSPALARLQKRGLELRWASEDFGPANKLVHSVRAFPERPIVVADDDMVYPRSWLRSLAEAARTSPGCVVAHRCVRLEGSISQNPPRVEKLRPYTELVRLGSAGGATPSMALLGEGFHGVYYPPGSLDSRLHDRELYTSLSDRNDDVWFKAMTALRGVPTRRVRAENPPFYRRINGTQNVALWHENSEQELTDKAIRAVIDYFGLAEILHNVGDPADQTATQ